MQKRTLRRAKFVSALLIPELIFATFLNIVFLKGVFDILLAKQAKWGQTDGAPTPVASEVPTDEPMEGR